MTIKRNSRVNELSKTLYLKPTRIPENPADDYKVVFDFNRRVRRRALLGAALRRSLQEVEDIEFETIDTTPTKGKDAA
jgi:hypothetical protein